MSLFFDLLRYEIKKVLCRKRTVTVLSIVTLLAALSVFAIIAGKVYYIDESGSEAAVSRYDEEMTDRKCAETISGRVIDTDLIMEAVEAYRLIPLDTDMYYSDTKEYREYARAYRDIYSIVCKTFSLSGVEDFQNLTREQAERFDEVRRAGREDVIAHSNISENMRAYWQKCLDRSPGTLTYEYHRGYYRFVAIMYTTAVMVGAAVAILFSGIFSDEYVSGADSLILSSKHGRGMVIGAKLCTVFMVSLAAVLLLTAMTYVETVLIWGSGGAECQLSLIGNIFPYPLTIGQSALLYCLCLTAACLFFSAITAALSAALKTPFNTIVIMAALLIAPMFVSVPDGAPIWVLCLENLLPTNMMAFWGAMYDYQYEIFGMVIPPYVFLPIFSAAGACVCSLLAYRLFGGTFLHKTEKISSEKVF